MINIKIAIIGAGPRGLLTAAALQSEDSTLNVHIYDPNGIGGIAWQTTQSKQLYMNTPAEQIQQFTSSPTLAEWVKKDATNYIKNSNINDDLLNDLKNFTDTTYPTRRLYGAYLKACWHNLSNNHVILHKTTIMEISKDGNEFNLTSNENQESFDQVVVTINNGSNQLTTQQASFKKYAEQYNLYYQAPSTTVNSKALTQIKPNQKILLRGLGLTFNDIVSELTQGRGGNFYRDQNNLLQYQASGQEPLLFAGSRRGVPYYPKPISQEGAVQSRPAIFLTKDNIIRLTKVNGTTHYRAFMYLLRLEIEYRYYSNWLKQNHHEKNLADFQKQFQQELSVPDGFIDTQALLNWDLIKNPVAGAPITNITDYQKVIIHWLQQVTADAYQGSKDSLLLCGLNATRQLRTQIKSLYNDDEISTDDFKNSFITNFVPLNAFLTSGAPAFRSEQLMALMQSGIVTIIPPQMQIIGANQHFLAISKFYPKELITADGLIEARQPSLNIMQSNNPLIKSLVYNGLISPSYLNVNGQIGKLPGANISDNYQAINRQNQLENHLFLFSQLTEGKRWLTNICPRTGDDPSRKAAQKISKIIINQ